jgi:hypothetical protein
VPRELEPLLEAAAEENDPAALSDAREVAVALDRRHSRGRVKDRSVPGGRPLPSPAPWSSTNPRTYQGPGSKAIAQAVALRALLASSAVEGTALFGYLEVSQNVHERGEGIPGGIPNRS